MEDETASLRAAFIKVSARVRHPELPLSVFALDLDDGDETLDDEEFVPEHEQEAAHARRGALIVAANEITEECINDLQELDFGPNGLPDPDEAEYSFIYRTFPQRHRRAYTEHFFRKVLVSVIKVAHDLCDPHAGPAACTAEEILRHLIIKHAIALCDLAELEPPRTHLSEYLLEDLDFEFLYDPDWDGFENDPALQAGLSMHVPDVQDWFTPFSDDRTVHPYAATPPTAEHQIHDLLARLNDTEDDESTVLATDIVDAPAPLSGLAPYSDLVAQARGAADRNDPDLWVADDTDPETSFSHLVRATTLSQHGSGWLTWEPHDDADTVRTDPVLTLDPHRHFPIGQDEPWVYAAIGAGRLLAIPLRAVVSYRPDPTSPKSSVDTNPSTPQWATKRFTPAEAIEAHRAFIARRRTTRPSEEYRTPTDQEWVSFLAHFEKRKVSVGTCARAFGSPCIHEHACVRCSLLRPDPAQRPRLEEIRDNLAARIIEAKREGWLGEVEGLQVSYSGAKDKLAQIDAALQRQTSEVTLGMPTFTSLAGRTTASTPRLR